MFTPKEIEILNRGLECYENEPASTSMVSSMFGVILDPDKNGAVEKAKKSSEDALVVVRQRKLEVARLRVKLLELAERPAEFGA